MSDLTLYGDSSPFDAIRREDERGEYWSARDLMPLLDYTKWERFEDAISRATFAARNAGQDPEAAASPKVEAHDAYIGADGLLLVREVAKLLGVTEKVLRAHLHDKKILMSHPSRRNEPYAEHVTAGRFEVKARTYAHPDGPVATHTTYVTPVGVEWLRGSLKRAGLNPRPRLTSVSGGVA